MRGLLLALVMGVVSPETGGGGVAVTEATLVLHTYECKLRVEGRITTTQVKASDAGQAKKLAQQQFPGATVLSVKKVD
jgi:hypothetical protein